MHTSNIAATSRRWRDSIDRRADDAITTETFDERLMPALGSEVIAFRAASESFAPARGLTRQNFTSSDC